MHHFLVVAELRMRIFEFLDPSDSKERSSLLALATTCRILSDTSLDILWEKQYGMMNLVRTMPQDLWTLVRANMSPEESSSWAAAESKRPERIVVKFQRTLVDSDWERFHYYSRKIHSLVLSFMGLRQEAVGALCAFRPPQTLLPSIQTLHMALSHSDIPKYADYVPAFLGSTLSSLEVSFPGADEAFSTRIEPLLLSIPRVCSDIRKLKVCLPMGDGRYLPVFHRLLPRLTRLERIFVGGVWRILETDNLSQLGSLPGVKALLNIAVGRTTKQPVKTLLANSFPELSRLTLSVHDWESTAEVLDGLNQPLRGLGMTPLPPLNAFTSYQAEAVSIGVAHELLSTVTSITSLTYLTLHRLSLSDPSSEKARSLPSLFLSLGRLEVFDLEYSTGLMPDDQWLLDASMAYPNLRKLKVCSAALGMSQQERPRMTLKGLLPILRNCHQLRDLVLTIRCEPFDWRTLYETRPNWVRRVRFVQCPVEQPKRVIGCLLSMFPNSTSIDGFSSITWEGFEHEYQSKRNWEEVQRFFSDYFKSAQ